MAHAHEQILPTQHTRANSHRMANCLMAPKMAVAMMRLDATCCIVGALLVLILLGILLEFELVVMAPVAVVVLPVAAVVVATPVDVEAPLDVVVPPLAVVPATVDVTPAPLVVEAAVVLAPAVVVAA